MFGRSVRDVISTNAPAFLMLAIRIHKEAVSLGASCVALQVLSIAKVHNRYLRSQFEGAQNNSNSSEVEGSKPCTDYMFYGEPPTLPGEQQGALDQLMWALLSAIGSAAWRLHAVQ